jgi:hypothetical protein
LSYRIAPRAAGGWTYAQREATEVFWILALDPQMKVIWWRPDGCSTARSQITSSSGVGGT